MEKFLSREAVLVHWEEFMDDIRGVAGEYETEGWNPLVLTSGDVTPVSKAPPLRGLDVLIPGETFATIRGWIEGDGREFERTEVFRQESHGVVFLLLALFDDPTDTAIFVPLYYHSGAAEEMIESVERHGSIFVSLRELSGEESIAFEHESPSLFLPTGKD